MPASADCEVGKAELHTAHDMGGQSAEIVPGVQRPWTSSPRTCAVSGQQVSLVPSQDQVLQTACYSKQPATSRKDLNCHPVPPLRGVRAWRSMTDLATGVYADGIRINSVKVLSSCCLQLAIGICADAFSELALSPT